MNAALLQLLDERGDSAFPHAAETVEQLLALFRLGKEGRAVAIDRVIALVQGDPGFAFNLARLMREDGMPLGTGIPVDLRAPIEKFNPFRAVAILAPKESHAEVFQGNPRVGTAYRQVAAAAVAAAASVRQSARVPADYRDVAQLMALHCAFGLLSVANLVPGKALPVLKAGAEADSVCLERLGFAVSDLAASLNERYALPSHANALYPGVVREAVRNAWDQVPSAATSSRRAARSSS